MEPQFVDRLLICSDCHGEFIFTAGEQLFFFDKQFKNDPKRCKPCKSRRSGLAVGASSSGPAAAGLSRVETRTECSECGVQTTVPFKPTQGRPVLCRQCFQAKAKTIAKPAEAANGHAGVLSAASGPTESALTWASANDAGHSVSHDKATVAAVSMASASLHSSVATASDLASIQAPQAAAVVDTGVPAALVAASAESMTPGFRVESQEA